MIDVEMLRPTADEMLSGLAAGDAMKRRLRFRAEAVAHIPEIAGEMLSGLHKTPALRHRILLAAERKNASLLPVQKPAQRQAAPWAKRLTPAMGMALILFLMIGIGANYQKSLLPEQNITQGMDTRAAGTQLEAGAAPQYRPLFAGQGANPPLIGMNGRYYRMLEAPAPVAAALLDGVLTEVTVFSEEPSLTSKVGIVSNVLPVGANVYAIRDISSKTLCAAEVDGAMRLFQRVSYASMGALENEMFDDIMDIGGMVSALELSGVGIITDEMDANYLIYLLGENAVNTGGEIHESDQALTIYLQNGLSLQLLVQDDMLGSCGTWVCPEFFSAFANALDPA